MRIIVILHVEYEHVIVFSDTLDAVKQSAALCLLRLIRNAPESVSMSEWSSRVIHLLNDQHMVSCHNGQEVIFQSCILLLSIIIMKAEIKVALSCYKHCRDTVQEKQPS